MAQIDLSVKVADVCLKNPVMTCSGTFGSGKEYNDFFDIGRLGAIVCKGVSTVPWNGNPTPRIAEVYGGMLNSVGLENPGVEQFITQDLPFLRHAGTTIVANLAGHTLQEYCSVAERLSETDVDMLELNISCPNIEEGGAAVGTHPESALKTTQEVKKVCKKPLIVKLSPNVTDISAIARAVEEGGADAVSLINTIKAMKIDIHKKRPVLQQNFGGLSGPAVTPIAVRMVYEVVQAVSIPVIGMGGITSAETALEFLLAGASAVAVGSAHFRDPDVSCKVLEGIQTYMEAEGFHSIAEIHEAFSMN